MRIGPGPSPVCNCLAVRQAARHVTQFYDRLLAPSGLRTTQYSILATLRRQDPMTINGLAVKMVMDRTTLGRNLLPLERDGLVRIEQGARDQRSKLIQITSGASGAWRMPPSVGPKRKPVSSRLSAVAAQRSCDRCCAP